MSFGAFYLSLNVFPLGFRMAFDLFTNHSLVSRILDLDPIPFFFETLWVASVVLLLWCDVTFVKELVAKKEGGRSVAYENMAATWLVRCIALGLTLYVVRASSMALRAFRLHRVDIAMTSIALVLAVWAFDTALIVHAFRRDASEVN
jgi:hypothetical protein